MNRLLVLESFESSETVNPGTDQLEERQDDWRDDGLFGDALQRHPRRQHRLLRAQAGGPLQGQGCKVAANSMETFIVVTFNLPILTLSRCKGSCDKI